MKDINKIKQRLGRNSFDRQEIGTAGYRTRGELYRGRALKADHKRNIAKQFGYPDTISLRMHYDMATRNGIGSNLAFGVVQDTWRVPPIIYDGTEDPERRKDNPTEFEQAIDEHFARLKVWERLRGLDRAQRPMRYGTMVYVTSGEASGVVSTDELVRLPQIDYLVDLRVFHEAQMQVETAYQDPTKLNYGQPILFGVRTNAAGSTNEWENSGYQVHASRTFTYGEGALDGSIYGLPCNEGAFEALMDLAKVRGSGCEGFFQNASNKYVNSLPENSTIADADEVIQSMEDFDNEISRSMVTVGDIKVLQTQLNDPTNPWTIALNEACAHHSKPAKVVIGMQTGERASTEDIRSWNRVVMDRQEQDGNAMILGLIQDWQEKFTFPQPSNGEITIVWRDLNESTAEQKVELAHKRATTNKELISAKMPPMYSLEYMQQEAGAPIEDVLNSMDIDIGGEDEDLPTESKST